MTARSRAAVVMLASFCSILWLSPGCGAPRARAASPMPGAAASAPLALVLSTDCGVDMDDQWALAHILLSRELDLRTIVTTHASSVHFLPTDSAATAAGVISGVDPTKRTLIPIVAGADSPLQDAGTPRQTRAVDALLRLSRDFSESRRLVVLSIGAGTDLASAILTDPSIANRIAVVAMGFNDWPDGGEEFNIKNDPLAWRVILDSRIPLVVGSGNAAKRSLRLTRTQAAAVMRAHGATGEYLYALFDEWLTRNAGLAGQVVAPGEWVVWDEVTVAYVLGLARGQDVPRPQLPSGFLFSHPRTEARITWIDHVDSDGLWRDFGRKLDRRNLE